MIFVFSFLFRSFLFDSIRFDLHHHNQFSVINSNWIFVVVVVYIEYFAHMHLLMCFVSGVFISKIIICVFLDGFSSLIFYVCANTTVVIDADKIQWHFYWQHCSHLSSFVLCVDTFVVCCCCFIWFGRCFVFSILSFS